MEFCRSSPKKTWGCPCHSRPRQHSPHSQHPWPPGECGTPPSYLFRDIPGACAIHASGHRATKHNSQYPKLELERERGFDRRMPKPAQDPSGMTPVEVASEERGSRAQGLDAGEQSMVLLWNPPMDLHPLCPVQDPPDALICLLRPMELAQGRDRPVRDLFTYHRFLLRPLILLHAHLFPPSASVRKIAQP